LTSAVQQRAFSASARDVSSPDSHRGLNSSGGAKLLTTSQLSKVTVLGAAGGIGQPLSLLLKLNPRVSDLALYDIRGGPGS
jgi:malate dehydrogenase